MAKYHIAVSRKEPAITHKGVYMRHGLLITLLAVGLLLGMASTSLATAQSLASTTGAWTLTGSLGTSRYLHGLALLQNGKVLAVAGLHNGTPLASSELYDPATGVWTPTGDLHIPRFSFDNIVALGSSK